MTDSRYDPSLEVTTNPSLVLGNNPSLGWNMNPSLGMSLRPGVSHCKALLHVEARGHMSLANRDGCDAVLVFQTGCLLFRDFAQGRLSSSVMPPASKTLPKKRKSKGAGDDSAAKSAKMAEEFPHVATMTDW